MMTDETPANYGTAYDPRPTLAQVLAAIAAADEYWNGAQEEQRQAD